MNEEQETRPKSEAVSRLELLRSRQNSRQLLLCRKLLDEAGVPEWVMNSDSDNVPSNSVTSRLKWYLARRKNVTPGEIDVKLNRSMSLK